MKQAQGKPALDAAGYVQLVQHATDAIIAVDPDGRVLVWNDAAETIFGYSRDSMLGEPVSKIIPDRLLREYEARLNAAVASGEVALSHFSTLARAANGREFPVEAGIWVVGRGENAVVASAVRRVSERLRKLTLLRESERRLREAEYVARMGSFEWNVGSDTISWSDELDRIYGFASGDNPRTLTAFLERVHPDDRAVVNENIRHAIATGSGWSMDERIIRADNGEVRVLASRVKAMRNTRGEVVRLCGTCHDVTEQRRAEEALAASEARFRRGFDDAPIGMLLVELTSDDAVITRTNKALGYLLGYTKAHLSNMCLSEVVDPEDWPLLHATLGRVWQERTAPTQVEIRLHARNGTRPIVVAAASRLSGEDGHSMLIVHVEDVTLRKQAEEQLRHRALHDPLTGLPNRDLLIDRLQGALARSAREGTCVAVLFLDLDNFKIVNDTIGHDAGDEILRTMANRLVAAARSGDTAARVGGDEFVMICENVREQEEIYVLARRIAGMLAAPILVNEHEFISTVSIGIAVGHEPRAPEQLVRDADLAMYRAKQGGKNTIEIFDETLRRHAWDRMQVERDLRAALQNGDIIPHYQPIVALNDGEVLGFEALARWCHAQRGLLRPHDFLTVAEDAHLIGALGSAMLDESCRQLAAWRKTSPHLTMAVNLSLRQLDGTFTDVLRGVLERNAIPAHHLHVEVTESVLIDMQKSAGTHLNSLAGLGVCLGIDDFGTGYSSLIYLKRFPVRFVKIDRSFVGGLPENQEDAAIVEAIIRLGQSLDLSTIAEGVETAEQFQALKELGCTCAQGHFFAPPRPAHECSLQWSAP